MAEKTCVGQGIKYYRKALKLTQSELSINIISRNQLSSIENCVSSTSDTIIFKLYRRLIEFSMIKKIDIEIGFREMAKHNQYVEFNSIVDKYHKFVNSTEEHNTMEILKLNSFLNINNYGMINYFFFKEFAEDSFKRGNDELGFSYLMKAFYWLAQNIDIVNLEEQEFTNFFKRAFNKGYELKKYFETLEVSEFWDTNFIINKPNVQNKSSFNLALLYKKIGLTKESLEKSLEIINDDRHKYTEITIPKTFHLLFNLYSESQDKSTALKYLNEAVEGYKLLNYDRGLEQLLNSLEDHKKDYNLYDGDFIEEFKSRIGK